MTLINFSCVLLYLSIRNLSLGAKAETAIGKHHIDLDKETRKQLMSLLRDDNTTEHKEVPV